MQRERRAGARALPRGGHGRRSSSRAPPTARRRSAAARAWSTSPSATGARSRSASSRTSARSRTARSGCCATRSSAPIPRRGRTRRRAGHDQGGRERAGAAHAAPRAPGPARRYAGRAPGRRGRCGGCCDALGLRHRGVRGGGKVTYVIARPGGGAADELPWARELPAELRRPACRSSSSARPDRGGGPGAVAPGPAATPPGLSGGGRRRCRRAARGSRRPAGSRSGRSRTSRPPAAR